jgi:hypothetical protein
VVDRSRKVSSSRTGGGADARFALARPPTCARTPKIVCCCHEKPYRRFQVRLAAAQALDTCPTTFAT